MIKVTANLMTILFISRRASILIIIIIIININNSSGNIFFSIFSAKLFISCLSRKVDQFIEMAGIYSFKIHFIDHVFLICVCLLYMQTFSF